MRLVLFLTASYLAVEVAGGFITGSLVLFADAGHVLVDFVGLSLALLAIHYGRKAAGADKTYGYYRLEILAALANAILMAGIGGVILVEAVQRFMDPPEIEGQLVFIFAVPGLLINLVSGLLLFEAQTESLNMRGAFLEVASDFVGSAAVLGTGAVLYFTSFKEIDPLVSLAIGLFILPRTWNLMMSAVHVLLEGTPAGMNMTHIQEHILGTPGVVGVHDLHVWSLTSGVNVLSAHVIVGLGVAQEDALNELSACLADHFDIEHSTFQIEGADRRATEPASH